MIRCAFRFRHIALFTLTLVLAISLQASAAVMTYSSSSTFSTDLATNGLTATTENFDSTAAGTTISDPGSVGHITFVDFDDPPLLLVADDFATTSGTNYLGIDSVGLANQIPGGYEIDLTFAASNAVGLTIITGEIPPPDAAQSIFDGDIQLVVPGVGTAMLDVDDLQGTVGGTDSVFFLGLVDTTNTFTTAQIRYAGAAVGTIVFNIDDIVTAVPEPASGGLMVLLIAAIAWVARRRR